jgi:hypothetical protein
VCSTGRKRDGTNYAYCGSVVEAHLRSHELQWSMLVYAIGFGRAINEKRDEEMGRIKE